MNITIGFSIYLMRLVDRFCGRRGKRFVNLDDWKCKGGTCTQTQS
ncbi:MAG TPA: hypothetical protein VJZ68_02070 [Nitrososphaera sp.]|nr:hypothetical protein [Nitrososphaera sp.]